MHFEWYICSCVWAWAPKSIPSWSIWKILPENGKRNEKNVRMEGKRCILHQCQFHVIFNASEFLNRHEICAQFLWFNSIYNILFHYFIFPQFIRTVDHVKKNKVNLQNPIRFCAMYNVVTNTILYCCLTFNCSQVY